jgi:tetratricopeptide (TPR) repeat protein
LLTQAEQELGPSAEVFRARAFVKAMSGDIKAAILNWTLSIELDRGKVAAYYERGLCYLETGEFDAAVVDFTTGIEVSHDQNNRTCLSALYLARGFGMLRLGRPVDARKDLEKVPDDEGIYVDRFYKKSELLEISKRS